MGDNTAFFYGTLMAPAVLYRVIYGTTTPEPWQRNLTTVRPALLQNYRRHKVRYADYPAILPHNVASSTSSTQPPPSVRGSLVTGLLDEDIRRLDIFEGDQYIRQKVKVKVLKSSVALDQSVDEDNLEDYVEEASVEAETYVWSVGRGLLEEREWDFDEFRREKMWAWVGDEKSDLTEVDDGFADVDRDVEERRKDANGHDPTGGRGKGGKITQELEGAAV